jgi:tRNA(Ile)-lysidine synthase
MAALMAADAWARAAGRRIVVLSVDHGLQQDSARWAAFVGETAARLGADFRALTWTGPKPPTGLAAAARAARHRLLAEAAREAGACVLVAGHTAGDARENALLGQGAIEEWSPSPVWPQGRGIFLLRPLLGLSRAAIRAALAADGVAHVDDPGNDDLRQPRVRARFARIEAEAPPPPPLAGDLARHVRFLAGGGLRLDRAPLVEADPARARRLLAAAMTSAGGGERPAQSAGVERLLDRLRGAGPVTATLAGARLVADDAVLVAREAGERRRKGVQPLVLSPEIPSVWDGRYEVEATEPGLRIDALRGHAARLPRAERAGLSALPSPLRPALPVILGPDGPTCPILAQKASPVRLTDLVPARFLGACGAIAQESELAQGAHGVSEAGVLCSRPVTE